MTRQDDPRKVGDFIVERTDCSRPKLPAATQEGGKP